MARRLLGDPFTDWHDVYQALRVSLEFGATLADVQGEASLWNPFANQWHLLGECDGIVTALSADGLFHNRASFEYINYGAIWLDAADGKWKARVRISHTREGSSVFITRHDLVQVAPYKLPETGGQAVGLPTSDANGDGVIDSGDVDQFLVDWLGQTPVADLDMNESVDLLDLAEFSDAYAEGR